MPKSRLSGDGRKARKSPVKKTTKKVSKKKASSETAGLYSDVHRFIGLSLGGGKSDKACMAVMEYYPKHKKVFLSRIIERIKSDENISADLKIHELIEQYHGTVEMVAFDVPFHLPLSLSEASDVKVGYENSTEPHIRWMWEHTKKIQQKKKPKKLFTPYTQRCVEMYVATELEEPFTMHHAMGANTAPLLARAMYIKRRLKLPAIEVFPKLSIWRLGRSLNVMKSHLRFHKHAIGGDESRKSILHALSTHNVAFVYDADVKLMIENNHAFEAFICALTAFLKYKGMTEPRPKGFPLKEDWIEFPTPSVKWNNL